MTDLAAPSPSIASTERKTPENKGFRPDIQGLRAIAVTMVVIYHLYPSAVPGGFAGVDVFFVISGYLITGHLWRGYGKTGSVSLADFWGRRARRLIPAAALVLTVTWIAARIVEPAAQLTNTAQQVIASAVYGQNWQLSSDAVNYLKSDDAATPVQHFWSLSVEEQFYILWPLLFLLAAFLAATFASRRRKTGPDQTRPARTVLSRTGLSRTGLSRTGLSRTGLSRSAIVIGLTAALVAASFAYSVYETAVDPSTAYFATATRIWELGAGGLLAIAPARLTAPLARQGWLGWAGLAAVIASAFVLSGSMAFPGMLALLPVLGAAALIAGGSATAGHGPSWLTSTGFMVFVGGISYSLYLWHYPIFNLYATWRGKEPGVLAGPLLVALAVLLAWLTKRFVEDKVRLAPFLAGHKWRSLLVALAVVVPVALAGTYLANRPAPWDGALGTDYPGAAVLAGAATAASGVSEVPPPDQISQSLYRTRGCLDDIPVSKPKPCVFGDTTNPVLTVALVGDSAAGEWFDALNAIAIQRHWRLVTELHSSCPWTAAMMTNTNGHGSFTACQSWGATVLHDLVTSIKPDVVITSDYPNVGTPDHPADESPAAMQEIGSGMAQYWATLARAGISVTAIKESPDVRKDVPTCVEEHSSDLSKCDFPASQAILAKSPISYAVKQAGSQATVVDANSLICGPKVCAPVVGNILVYSDRHHLTWPYSKTTAPFLERLLLKANSVLAGKKK